MMPIERTDITEALEIAKDADLGIIPYDSMEAVAARELVDKSNSENQSLYKSSHWDESNILAHIRLNEKTLPDGRRVLIVNEVQSDWAQDGRSKGFVETGKFDKSKVTTKESGNFIEIYYDGKWIGKLLTTYSTKEEIERDILRSAETDFNLKKKAVTGKIQNMPYKNTDQWTSLVMRRVLQMATQEGYDGIALATGQQSADMYSLAKQVDNISWDTSDNTLVAKDKNGKTQFQESGVIEEQLEKYVGKEVAQKLIDKRETLEEEDEGVVELYNTQLVICGEGMKTFYDNIVTKVAQKEAQRFD